MLDHSLKSWRIWISVEVLQKLKLKKKNTLFCSLLFFSSLYQPFSDHGVQAPPHQPFAQNAIAMPAPVSQTKQVKVSMVVLLKGVRKRGKDESLLLMG